MFGSSTSAGPRPGRRVQAFGSPAAAAPAAPPGATLRALPRGVRVARTLREVVLWVAAMIGVLCLLVAAAAVLLHVTPLVFRSGSMSPGIPTGSVGLARSIAPSDVRVGQIVSVVLPDGARVTHRVVGVAMQGEAARIRLKGDANAEADPVPVTTTAIDRVFWSAPGLGYLLQSASRPAVVFVGGALIGMIAMWGFRKPAALPGEPVDGSEDDDTVASGRPLAAAPDGREARGTPVTPAPAMHTAGPRHAAWGRTLRARGAAHRGPTDVTADGTGHGAGHRAGHVAALVAAGIVLTLGSVMGLGAQPAVAAPWTDPVTASGTLRSGTLTAPLSFTCTPSNGITLTWAPPAPTSVRPDHYTITSTNNGLGADLPSSGRITGTSYNYGPSLLTIGNTYTFTLTAWTGNWSASASTKSATVLLGLIVACNNA